MFSQDPEKFMRNKEILDKYLVSNKKENSNNTGDDYSVLLLDTVKYPYDMYPHFYSNKKCLPKKGSTIYMYELGILITTDYELEKDNIDKRID